MSAVFAGLKREDRVLPVEGTRIEHISAVVRRIDLWKVDVVGASIGCSDNNALFERAQFYWTQFAVSSTTSEGHGCPPVSSQASNMLRVDRQSARAAVLRKLLPGRAHVRRVGNAGMYPTSRLELLEAQRRHGYAELVRCGSTSTDKGSNQRVPPLDRLPRRMAFQQYLSPSDWILQYLCPTIIQPILPCSVESDRGWVLCEQFAARYCVTMQSFHFLSTVVWLLFESIAQQRGFQSITDLSHFFHSADFSVATLHCSRLHPSLQCAISLLLNEWLKYRMSSVSSTSPCGIAACTFPTDREPTVWGTEPIFAIHSSSSRARCRREEAVKQAEPRASSAVTIDRVVALIKKYDGLLLTLGIHVLLDEMAAGSEAATLSSSKSGTRHSTGACSTGALPCWVPESCCGSPPLLIAHSKKFGVNIGNALSAVSISSGDFTVSDIADVVCYFASSLLVPPHLDQHMIGGVLLRHTLQVELAKYQRDVLESALTIKCPAVLSRLLRDARAAHVLHWFVSRPRLASSSSCTSMFPLQNVVALGVMFGNGSTMPIGTPWDLITRGGVASTPLQQGKEDRGASSTEAVQSAVEERPPESVFDGVALPKITLAQIQTFLRLMVARAQAKLQGVAMLSGVALRVQGRVLLPISNSVAALQYALQCHPEYRYIQGCGIRGLYVTTESGSLVVERVCHRFCDWDVKKCFDFPERGGCLYEPRMMTVSPRRLPLPRCVEYHQIRQGHVLGMVAYYWKQLRSAIADQTGSEGSRSGDSFPDGRLFVHTADFEVLKYVVSHHQQYFARRGCGIMNFYVSFAEQPQLCNRGEEIATSNTAYCHIFGLRHCGTTTEYDVRECFMHPEDKGADEGEALKFPIVLSDCCSRGNKRHRMEADDDISST